MSNNENSFDEFITICDDENISEEKFKKNVIKYCNIIENKSSAIKFTTLVIDKIVSRYALIKILFDYICEKFDIDKKEIRDKPFIDKYFRYASREEPTTNEFNMSLYFYDIESAIKLLDRYEFLYIAIIEENPIEENYHRKIIRTKKFTRDYFSCSVYDKNFGEVEKCFKYGYRPCKKTFSELLGDWCNPDANDIIILIDLLIKYDISLKKIGHLIFREAIYRLSVELLDVCLKYGFDITIEKDKLQKNKINFIQKLINIGIDTFEIVDIMDTYVCYSIHGKF